MKRKFYSTLSALLLTAIVYSQEVFKPELAVGVSFGTSYFRRNLILLSKAGKNNSMQTLSMHTVASSTILNYLF